MLQMESGGCIFHFEIEETAMPQFSRCLVIDYSGAEIADSSCKGLRVYMAERSAAQQARSMQKRLTAIR